MQPLARLSSKVSSFGKRVMNRLWLISSALLLTSCADYQTYTPAPIDIEQTTREYRTLNIESAEVRNWLDESDQNVQVWPKERWDVESLVLVGQYLNADLDVAKAKVKVAEAAEITAGQKLNPQIELSAEHHSDQFDGVSPWTFGSIFSWVYQRQEKRQTRIDYAKAVTEVARLKAFEIKWQIRDQIMDSYLDTMAAIKKKEMLLVEKEIVQEALDLLERSLELGQVSDFEINSTRLEMQRLMLALSEVDADQIRSRTRLALSTGLAADGLDNIDLDDRYLTQLPDLDSIDLELDLLQVRALVERPDVLGVLSEYVVAEADLHREIENQYPDITLSPAFIFDQDDNIWALATSWALPINALNEGQIAEAEARRELKAQEFLAFQKEVLGQVHGSRIGYRSALDTLQEADALISDLQSRDQKIQKQYDHGYTDRLTVIRSQLEILTAKQSRFQLELSAWREFAGMEDASMRRLTK